jgi:hypothetical protein
MPTTEEERLGNWNRPVTRIVNHMIPLEKQPEVIDSIKLLKNHHDQTGMTYSGLDRVIEVCYVDQDGSPMRDALRCLGFRGDYVFASESADMEKYDESYDLCVLSRHANKRKLKNLMCNNFLRAFKDG